MKFTPKNYNIIKPKKNIKMNHLIFFVNGICLNSMSWIKTKQTLQNFNLICYKILNRATLQTFEKSIYCRVKPLIHGVTFFLKFKSVSNILEKKIIIKQIESLSFNIMAVKFNNNIYSVNQLKSLNSMKYYENKLLLYKFMLLNLKVYNKYRKN